MIESIHKTIKKQICPTCKRYVRVSTRYPSYVCRNCVSNATDKDGKLIEFYNTEPSGHGFEGNYSESRDLYSLNTCFIKGIKCHAEEAYMGGIVVMPADKHMN